MIFTRKTHLFTIILWGLLVASCVEPFQGSRIVGNLYVGDEDPNELVTPPRMPDGAGGYLWIDPSDPGYVDHYELYAGIEGQGSVRILNFLIRPLFEVHHPCYTVFQDDIRITDDGSTPYINMCRDPYPLLEEYMFALVSAAPTGIGDANPGYRYLEWGEPLRSPENDVTDPDCDGPSPTTLSQPRRSVTACMRTTISATLFSSQSL